MRETKKVGIATLVLREREHLVAVRPGDDALILETMYFADEIRNPREELGSLPDSTKADARELSIAKKLVESLSDPWDPRRYQNTYRERVEELVEKRRAGHAVVFGEDDAGPRSNVVDLMTALQASIERTSKTQRPARTAAKQSTVAKRSSMRVSTHREKQGFTAMSKADLLDRAARLKIDVNSRMTKPELVKVLADAAAKKSGDKVS
jgi:DNA end-binding protein Ku